MSQGDEVVSRTPPIGVAIIVLSFGTLIILPGYLAWASWQELGLVKKLFSVFVVCMLALACVDQLQRVYSFRSDHVAVRYLGVWRRTSLPSRLAFMRYPKGDLVLLDADEGPFRFKVAGGWTKHGELISSLSRFYSSRGRYGDDAPGGA